MDLRTYLFQHRLTKTDFSNIIGYSRMHLRMVFKGKTRPGPKLIKAIAQATGGLVQRKDILEEIEENIHAQEKMDACKRPESILRGTERKENQR